MRLTQEQQDIVRQLGRVGGQTTKKKYGKKHYQEMNKKSLEAKKIKQKQGTFDKG